MGLCNPVGNPQAMVTTPTGSSLRQGLVRCASTVPSTTGAGPGLKLLIDRIQKQ